MKTPYDLARQRSYQEAIVLLEQIRLDDKHTGLPISFEGVAKAIQPDKPIVYVDSTPDGGLALIAYKCPRANSVEFYPIWLDNFNIFRLIQLLFGEDFLQSWRLEGWFGAYKRWERENDDDGWLKTVKETARTLWDEVIGPVVDALKKFSARQAILLPGGLLALLPLHAAWTMREWRIYYAIDDVFLTYAPSALSLCQAQERVVKVVESLEFLVVVDPQPTTSFGPPLTYANIEMKAIADIYPNDSICLLTGKNATRKKVLDFLPFKHVVHFCCHGEANWLNWTDSHRRGGLQMPYGEILTAQDIFELPKGRGRLVILSGCETGIIMPSRQTRLSSGKFVALPAAFMQAGFSGVVASLWRVVDGATSMLMERFHRFWRMESFKESPGEALLQAQQWMRNTNNDEKVKYYEELHETYEQSHYKKNESPYLHLIHYVQKQRYGFEHPFWWAGFYFSGV